MSEPYFKVVSRDDCRFCTLAKSALDARDHDYEEITLTPEVKASLKAEGLTTVPQVYHSSDGGKTYDRIGGYDDLVVWLKNKYRSQTTICFLPSINK